MSGVPDYVTGPSCPECVAGKHPNCTRQALDPATDEFVDCACERKLHGLLR
ncbi:MAG TPA: hypothetical protein VFV01_47655 [Spirillospora sp.]|nr:hypothetical protein [Spirillospora sp.]